MYIGVGLMVVVFGLRCARVGVMGARCLRVVLWVRPVCWRACWPAGGRTCLRIEWLPVARGVGGSVAMAWAE